MQQNIQYVTYGTASKGASITKNGTLDNIFNEVMHYESLYHCLCSSFSKAYLEGSDWYIGESLVDWWLCVESDVNSYNKKFDKFDYIKEIIDMFMNKDTNNK